MSTEKYFIRKHGMFYRPNKSGYTQSVLEAGLYDKDDALGHAKMCEELQTIPVSDWFESDKELEAYLKQATAIRDCLFELSQERKDEQ